MDQRPMPITRQASAALDLLRLSAALTVFLHHVNWLGLDGGALSWFRRDVGHSAVVIFFVLSGYLISATSRRDRPMDYAIKRASRIYSVAVPAIALTVLLDAFSVAWQLPVQLQQYELHRPLVYAAFSLVFAGDFWSLGVPAFSNVPVWSLGYEVWYYIVFGVALFGRGTARVVGVALLLALIGPKLWVLFPIWLGGVAAERLAARRPLPVPVARAVAVGAVAAFLILKALHVEDAINDAVAAAWPGFVAGLRFSQWFVGDWLVGVLTVALVYALATAEVPMSRRMRAVVVAGAGVSFSLYLVHFPLLQVFGQLLPGPAAAALALTVAAGFGAVFEPLRSPLRRLLSSRLTPAKA